MKYTLEAVEEALSYHKVFVDMFLYSQNMGMVNDHQLFSVLRSLKNNLWNKWKDGSMFDIYIGSLWLTTPTTSQDLKEQEERLWLALGMISSTLFTRLGTVSRREIDFDGEEYFTVEKSEEEYVDDLNEESDILIDLFEKFEQREYRGDKIIKKYCSKCERELDEATNEDKTQ